MLDSLFWIILIFYVVYYIKTKTFWFQNTENVFEKEAKELGEWVKKDKEFAEKWKSESSKEAAKSSEERLKKIIETHDNYLRLKEKFRHDSRRNQINSDWHAYLRGIRDMLDTEMDFMMLDDDKLLQEAGDKKYKANITLEEIEKRFAKHLKD